MGIVLLEPTITFGRYCILEGAEIAHDEAVDLEPVVHPVRDSDELKGLMSDVWNARP